MPRKDRSKPSARHLKKSQSTHPKTTDKKTKKHFSLPFFKWKHKKSVKLEKKSTQKQPTQKKKTSKLSHLGTFLRYVNQPVMIVSFILLMTGILMVFTASSYIVINSGGHNVAQYAIRQAAFCLVGMVPLFGLYPLKTALFRNHQLLQIAVAILVILLLVARFLFAPVNGAHGWITLGPISIQPMEFVKPIIVLLWADYYTLHGATIQRIGFFKTLWQHPLVPAMTGLFFLLTVMMPDFGGLLILGSIWGMMSLASGVSPKYTLRLLGAVVVLYLVMVTILSVFDLSHLNQLSYVVRRFTAFVNPFADERGTGLQLVNSYYALGRGGIVGVGAGNSIQKMGYLPEAHNDFIMAIVGEEFGLMGIVLILALYYFLTFYLFNKAVKMKHGYHQLVLVGIASYFLVQSFVNLGAVTGLLPITGVTFPFISYGGSSILVTMIMLGLALAVLRTDYKQEQKQLLSIVKSPVKQSATAKH